MKKHLTIRLEEELIKQIKTYAINREITVSEIVRQAFEERLKPMKDWKTPILANGWKEVKPSYSLPEGYTLENGMVKDKEGKVLFCAFAKGKAHENGQIVDEDGNPIIFRTK